MGATDAAGTPLTLGQGQRSVKDYAVEFRTVASRGSWPAAFLADAFLHGLADYRACHPGGSAGAGPRRSRQLSPPLLNTSDRDFKGSR